MIVSKLGCNGLEMGQTMYGLSGCRLVSVVLKEDDVLNDNILWLTELEFEVLRKQFREIEATGMEIKLANP